MRGDGGSGGSLEASKPRSSRVGRGREVERRRLSRRVVGDSVDVWELPGDAEGDAGNKNAGAEQ